MMNDDTADAVFVWRSGATLLTIEEVSHATGLHPRLIASFVEFGLVEPAEPAEPVEPPRADLESARFSAEAVDRLRRIVRLRHDLGVNLAGVAVILEMRDRMEELQREVEHLRRRLGLED
jgi:DNA-binding transcriptional MerR regulator